jgi:hypothetical protein
MRRVIPVLIAASAALAVAGCFNPFNPAILTERVTSVAPSPTTPQNVVRLFEWCWKNRGIEEYREIFTADYEFLSAGLDSAGNQTREIQARRDDEVQTAENMFIGSAERAPAAKITLDFDRNLIPFPDTRDGKTAKWHQTVRTSVNLKVDIDEGNALEVTGFALFYVVRGDSAAIPPELFSRGFRPDSLRWWIERWEDETLAPEGLVAGPGGMSLRPVGTWTVRRTSPGLAATSIITPMTMAELKRYFAGLPALRAAAASARSGGTEGRARPR